MAYEIIFWASLGFLFYAYAGYAVLVFAWSRIAGRDVDRRDFCPDISIVIAAYNEERYIRRKMESILEMDYPPGKFEIVLVSDGSDDDTCRIAESFAGRFENIRILRLAERRGKAAALNYGIADSRSEVIVLTDARQVLAGDAVRKLVSNFHDPSVGAVSGALVLTGRKERGGHSFASYWSLEKLIRKSESRIHSVVGLTGAVSAVRRDLYEELPEGTILDDVMIPMKIALKGYRIVFEERALAYDDAEIDPNRELKRKIRTLTGNFQLLQRMPALLSWRKNPLFFQYFSHKITRLIAPLFMVALLLSNMLASGALYSLFMYAQAGFYLVALYGLYPNKYFFPRLFSFPAAFLLMNYAVLKAFYNSVSGTERVWTKE
jgi:cellulose synthase/poly-beta-1,6-N-acetylglucosamine synthase-like glycosyltransferase